MTEIDEPKSEQLETIQTAESVIKEVVKGKKDLSLSFTTLLENKEAIIDETVEFRCEMTQPGMEVVWLKNHQPLSVTDGRYEIINQECSYQLIIPNVTTEDNGEYTIKAGELQSTAVLAVNGWYKRKLIKIFHFINYSISSTKSTKYTAYLHEGFECKSNKLLQ